MSDGLERLSACETGRAVKSVISPMRLDRQECRSY